MHFLRLFNRFVLRALLREKARSAVATLGVGLGVAVMIAIRLANVSVTETFKAAVDSVSGSTSLRIRGTAGRFDERLFAELAPVRAYGQVSPIIETYAMVASRGLGGDKTADGFPRGELLHVLGVDVLLDYPLRAYQVLRVADAEKQSAREALRLLDDPTSVILTEKFLRRHGLRVGDDVPLTFGSQTQDFTIRGVLLDSGPAQTLDGNFALMDIAAAQLAADRLGSLDYVDVLLKPELDAERMLPKLQQTLPAGLVAELPAASSGRADTMIAAFQFNLTALSAVALIVGLFLIYNTVAMSVAARRKEIGVLQAIGSGRTTVLALFLSEALVLALMGMAIGLPAGRLLGSAAVTATAQTVETFYIAAVAEASASALRLTVTEILAAAGIVIPLSLVAALIPAWAAASVQPIEAVRGSGVRLSHQALLRLTVSSMCCLGLGWLLTRGEPIGGRPILGFLAELVFMLAGAMMVPLLLRLACGCQRLLARLVPKFSTELRLAAANLEFELPRVSIAAAALGISLSMMIAIAVMVGSFRETVVYWLDSALSADLSIKPVMQTSSVSEARLSKHTVDVVSQDPDVADTVWFSARQMPFRGRSIRLGVTEVAKTLKHERLIFKVPPNDTGDDDEGMTSLLVSESFALLFDVAVGEMVDLPTPGGRNLFQVAGVYYDYASNQGTVLLDAEAYRRHFGDSDSGLTAQHLSVFVRPTADVAQVRRRILENVGEREQIYCATSGEVREEALQIFESTFAVTYALQMIAILVAGLGVATTLIALVYQRQRDIGLLSLIGATRKQVCRVIVFEALLLGGVSQVVGIMVGMLLAVVLIYVINVQSFGWTIQFHLPLAFLIQSTLLVLVASGWFGLYPAIRAAGVDALRTVREAHGY